jgi:hypothetical protein
MPNTSDIKYRYKVNEITREYWSKNMSLTGLVFRWFYETAARGKSYDDLLQKLERNEAVTHKRMLNGSSIAFNRERSAHVIGIERWAAHRLRVLLGEPLVIDEYDGYAPSKELSMEELAGEFLQTRAETKALVRELQQRGIPITQTVKHNEVGDLSAGGWLFYIENHTGRETSFLMQRRQKPEQDTVRS